MMVKSGIEKNIFEIPTYMQKSRSIKWIYLEERRGFWTNHKEKCKIHFQFVYGT